MNLPEYVLIASTSYMVKNSDHYSTRGWDLPISNIEEIDRRFYIKSFMRHLNGKELVPITKKEYEADQH